MKCALLFTLLVTMASLSGCTTNNQQVVAPAPLISASPDSSNESIERTITQLETDWADAMTRHDMVTLDRILGDDHTVISKDGSVHTKTEELANYKSEESS